MASFAVTSSKDLSDMFIGLSLQDAFDMLKMTDESADECGPDGYFVLNFLSYNDKPAKCSVRIKREGLSDGWIYLVYTGEYHPRKEGKAMAEFGQI